MRRLAIIEDDAAYTHELRAALEPEGFRTECFDDAARALAEMRSRAFLLAILDLGVRDVDPFAVCREASGLAPLITVTAECGEEICVRAFESGADDCVVRPVAGRELVARIRNVLRRVEGSAGTHDLAGTLSISIAEMRVREGDRVHDLTRGETEILSLLLDAAPAPLTTGRMASLLDVPRGTVESRIKSLRAKLGPAVLVSRGRLGYQLEPHPGRGGS